MVTTGEWSMHVARASRRPRASSTGRRCSPRRARCTPRRRARRPGSRSPSRRRSGGTHEPAGSAARWCRAVDVRSHAGADRVAGHDLGRFDPALERTVVSHRADPRRTGGPTRGAGTRPRRTGHPGGPRPRRPRARAASSGRARRTHAARARSPAAPGAASNIAATVRCAREGAPMAEAAATPARTGGSSCATPGRVLLVGGAVSVALGVYGKAHDPTREAARTRSFFTGTIQLKVWFATAAVALAVVQVLLGAAPLRQDHVPAPRAGVARRRAPARRHARLRCSPCRSRTSASGRSGSSPPTRGCSCTRCSAASSTAPSR